MMLINIPHSHQSLNMQWRKAITGNYITIDSSRIQTGQHLLLYKIPFTLGCPKITLISGAVMIAINLFNGLILTTLFVLQPLALPGSANNYKEYWSRHILKQHHQSHRKGGPLWNLVRVLLLLTFCQKF